jgi:hypothetical protein
MTGARGVVYTTSIGSRDEALPHIAQRTADADYVCFADPAGIAAHQRRGTWEIRPAWPVDDCPARAARFHKCCPHRVLPGYDWWIWVDGNTTLRGEMSELLTDDLVLLTHPGNHTLQDEFDLCRRRRRAAPSLLAKQYAAYVSAGVPMDSRIPQTSVLARRNIGWVCALNDTWWQELEKFTQRDQLSIVPTLREHAAPLQYRPWSSVSGRLFDLNYAVDRHTELAYTGYQHALDNAGAADQAIAAEGAVAWYQHAHYAQPRPPYRFSKDWAGWLQRKLRVLRADGYAPRDMLEIGVYEARGTSVAVETLPSIRAWTGVDPWAGTAPSAVRERAEWNLRQMRMHSGVSIRIFDTIADAACRRLREAGEQFDLIYVDGDHSAPSVLADSRNAWALLRPGGIVVWDDIPWTPDDSTDTPVRTGVDQFLGEIGRVFDELHYDGWQCHLVKPA